MTSGGKRWRLYEIGVVISWDYPIGRMKLSLRCREICNGIDTLILAEEELIGPSVAGQNVIVCASCQLVVTGPAEQYVLSSHPVDNIIATATFD